MKTFHKVALFICGHIFNVGYKSGAEYDISSSAENAICLSLHLSQM